MRATDPAIIFMGHAFEYFITFVIVWTIVFFMSLPIGMGKEEEKGRAEDVRRKMFWSALVSLVISGAVFAIVSYYSA